MSPPACVIGIDTGGTYTDAVVLDRSSGRVLAGVKTPTTPHDPAVAIGRSLEKVLLASGANPETIELVTVSTTLATNALVEDKGAEVGLFVIGHDKRLHIPAADMRFIPGGHKARGVEAEPLGMDYLIQGIAAMKGRVDAYAVCAMLAFEDPTHELVAAKAIELMDQMPVFCSHQASTRPGMEERAATAVLNARLLPVMQDFLRGIARSMERLGLSCPVRIVRGDCQSMDLPEAVRNSSATVASGPAATALFGGHAAAGETALIVDVGGTTTDITLIREGHPVVREEGMTIGSWRTHVRAVEMYTVGLGGDSLARVENGRLSLGPARVVPLSQIHLHLDGPALASMTRPEAWLGADLCAQCVQLAPGTDPGDDQILRWLAEHGPATPMRLRQELALAESNLEKAIARLQAARRVVTCGFTPTDALHVLGRLDLGDARPAMEGAGVLAALLSLAPEAFCDQVLEKAHATIATTILCALGNREVGPALAHFFEQPEQSALLDITIRVRPRIIGIGAAAPFLLPEVAARLGTEAVFPEHYEVGNALGAALMDTITKE
ncbi:N-methylhydantoinase A/oxoprolinase/acetone carboxylase, beta subunit [Desulfomicrobium apsheronum]|uniref:N-methylhydantoinase A/oxoprolinase/acetone carboxylase, beta subunit n=1 Tax=Desulfomicrobium apsheronum TaxID=52560 RepID=A0A1I3TZJ6_9BACT|nr:hydantoinase/oxoprolinase family protein [Desulfomicrobium apsheronum]SFJ74971.1 N-methylhydantoinase A/oxoprolinase/acetone carboxylase, beta subunit [Desulfomicrobium apsheronum]